MVEAVVARQARTTKSDEPYWAFKRKKYKLVFHSGSFQIKVLKYGFLKPSFFLTIVNPPPSPCLVRPGSSPRGPEPPEDALSIWGMFGVRVGEMV